MFAWIPPLHVIVYCRFARVADENVYAGTGQGQGKGDPDPYGVRSPVALDSRAVVDCLCTLLLSHLHHIMRYARLISTLHLSAGEIHL